MKKVVFVMVGMMLIVGMAVAAAPAWWPTFDFSGKEPAIHAPPAWWPAFTPKLTTMVFGFGLDFPGKPMATHTPPMWFPRFVPK